MPTASIALSPRKTKLLPFADLTRKLGLGREGLGITAASGLGFTPVKSCFNGGRLPSMAGHVTGFFPVASPAPVHPCGGFRGAKLGTGGSVCGK